MTFYSPAEERSSSADRRLNKLAESLRSKSQPQLSLWWFTLTALKRSNSTDRRYNRTVATNRKVRPTGSRLSRRDAVTKRSSSRDRRNIKTCASEYGINNNASKPDSPDRDTESAVSFARDRKTLFQRFMSKFPSAVKFIRKRFQTDEELDNNDTSARSGSFGYVGDTRNKRRRLKPKTYRSNISGFDSVSLESYFCSEASLTPSPDPGDRNNSVDDTTQNAEYVDVADDSSNDKTSAHNIPASNISNEAMSHDRAAMIQQYHEMLKCFCENEANINQNARELEAQDREIEKYMELTETHSDELARETADFYNVRKVHKNFMDEATRVRVEHKEHLLSADILQGENAEMKEDITILCGKVGEVKERVTLGLTEVINDTVEMKLVIANMRLKNNIRERETEAKKDELNEIKMAMQENGIQFKSRKPVYSFDGSAPLPPQMRGARSPTPSSQMDIGLVQQSSKAAK